MPTLFIKLDRMIQKLIAQIKELIDKNFEFLDENKPDKEKKLSITNFDFHIREQIESLSNLSKFIESSDVNLNVSKNQYRLFLHHLGIGVFYAIIDFIDNTINELDSLLDDIVSDEVLTSTESQILTESLTGLTALSNIIKSYDELDFHFFYEIISLIHQAKPSYTYEVKLTSRLIQVENTLKESDNLEAKIFHEITCLLNEISSAVPSPSKNLENALKSIVNLKEQLIRKKVKEFKNKLKNKQGIPIHRIIIYNDQIDEFIKLLENPLSSFKSSDKLTSFTYETDLLIKISENLLALSEGKDLDVGRKSAIQKIVEKLTEIQNRFKLYENCNFNALIKIQLVCFIKNTNQDLLSVIEKYEESHWKKRSRIKITIGQLLMIIQSLKCFDNPQFNHFQEMAYPINQVIQEGLIQIENEKVTIGTDSLGTDSLKKLIQVEKTLNSYRPQEPFIKNSLRQLNADQREALKRKLSVMNPYHFEILIKELLMKMGYKNIEVTQKSRDMGIDLTAELDNHIIRFVVAIQVKRQQANIQRPVIDQLQGALHYYKANRGIIISLGGFSEGAKEGAVSKPGSEIVLIDGEQLLDLLFEHQIGIKTESFTLHKINDDFFEKLGENQ